MSMDIVDDLHGAEDLIGELEQALREALVASFELLPERGLAAMRAAITYCRPTCGMEGRSHPGDDDLPGYDPLCGCPCHDRTPTEGATS